MIFRLYLDDELNSNVLIKLKKITNLYDLMIIYFQFH